MGYRKSSVVSAQDLTSLRVVYHGLKLGTPHFLLSEGETQQAAEKGPTRMVLCSLRRMSSPCCTRLSASLRRPMRSFTSSFRPCTSWPRPSARASARAFCCLSTNSPSCSPWFASACTHAQSANPLHACVNEHATHAQHIPGTVMWVVCCLAVTHDCQRMHIYYKVKQDTAHVSSNKASRHPSGFVTGSNTAADFAERTW